MKVDIEELVDQARGGSDRAMKLIYDDQSRRIFNLAFGYAGNVEDAEEIMQETFTKAFISLRANGLRENRFFPSWLYRIGINTAISHVKKRKSQRVESLEALGDRHIQPPPHSTPTPEQDRSALELAGHLAMAVKKLTAKQRMIFTLKHQQQLKIREIADLLECSEGNVKQQLHRSIQRLRKELLPHFTEVNHGL